MPSHISTVENLEIKIIQIPVESPGSNYLRKKPWISVSKFFKKMNPAKWFYDLSNIEITLEEFSNKKK
jgi:hypothetical protein